MRKLNYFLSILFSTALIGQDVWGDVSVAMPDNINAISGNPAGLGIARGNQSGLYIPFGSVFTIHTSSRFNGIGFELKKEFKNGKLPDLFNPSDGTIGFGTSLFPNAYAGLKWNKFHFIDIGLLYRPLNQVSLGMTAQFNDEFSEYYQSTFGFAVRPFLQHRLTVGADINLKYDDESLYIHPHMTIKPIEGISLSARSNSDFDDFKINLAFNLGKETVYSPASYNTNSDYKGGIGFYSDTEQQKSIFKKKTKAEKHYIRMKLSGLFIEEKPVDAPLFDQIFNSPEKGIQLRSWIEEIDQLAKDDDVDGLIIDMGSVRAGWAKRIEIRNALKRFQNNNDKDLIVYADKGITNKDYYLISMADNIFLNEYTGIWLKGLRFEISFFRGLLDTLSIVPEVVRVNYDGKSYKTYGDQFLNRKMSKEMEENYTELADDLYNIFVDGISERFGMDYDKTDLIINNGPYWVSQAVSAGLADSIMYPDQFDDYLNALNDEKVKITKWKNIDRSNFYIHEWAPAKKSKIAVIYAVGGIVSGKSNPGPTGSSRMGDKTIREAIKSARENEEIKAIVLRIDSGGGSALASDQMWREILQTTKKDSANIKPFIASMSDVAASGGYYIACEADTIIASPGTITGSIGVIWLRINISQLIKRIGINTQWIKKGDHSDFSTGSRLLNEDEKKIIQDRINDIYSKFKNRIQNGRENISKSDDLDQVAMGRVFTGNRALGEKIPLALVDTTGSFQDAIQIAQNAAGLEGKEIEIVEYPKPKDPFSEFFKKNNSHTQTLNILKEVLPEEFSEYIEMLDILPIILDDEMQMLIPYQITIE